MGDQYDKFSSYLGDKVKKHNSYMDILVDKANKLDIHSGAELRREEMLDDRRNPISSQSLKTRYLRRLAMEKENPSRSLSRIKDHILPHEDKCSSTNASDLDQSEIYPGQVLHDKQTNDTYTVYRRKNKKLEILLIKEEDNKDKDAVIFSLYCNKFLLIDSILKNNKVCFKNTNCLNQVDAICIGTSRISGNYIFKSKNFDNIVFSIKGNTYMYYNDDSRIDIINKPEMIGGFEESKIKGNLGNIIDI